MDQKIFIDELCRLGHTQGYISVEQLDDALTSCGENEYEVGAVYGAVAALAQFGIFVTQHEPAPAQVHDRKNFTLAPSRPVDVQLPVAEWLKLYLAADAADLQFAATVIDRELSTIEQDIVTLRGAVQLTIASDNGYEPQIAAL